MSRGWTAQGLAIVGEDEHLWTVEEAAQLLDVDVTWVRQLIALGGMEPVGTRRSNRLETRGRLPRVYRAIDFIKKRDALSRAA